MFHSSRAATIVVAYIASFAMTATPLTEAFIFTAGSNHNNKVGGCTVRHMRESTIMCESAVAVDQRSISSRRSFIAAASSSAAAAIVVTPPQPAFAADENKESLIADLKDSLSKIQTIPPLLESSEWDKVRTVLKTPPVNQLWNLGESKNTLVKLAKETGDFELMEMKDELAISLQMTDQYSYDNVFIYYQPGNGKVKVKEPLEMAKKAISQLKEALDVATSG